MQRLILAIAVLLVSLSVSAQDSYTYEKGEFISQTIGDTLLYRYLTPENSKKGKKYPAFNRPDFMQWMFKQKR